MHCYCLTTRWFLIHWLLLHFLSLVGLFISSILLFAVQVSLFKLFGLIPVVAALLTLYCWLKVGDVQYLFEYP